MLWFRNIQEKLENQYLFFFATKTIYISSSFWLLGVESRVFSYAVKERTAFKAEQIHKMATNFTQNGPRSSFWVKIVVFLSICSAL